MNESPDFGTFGRYQETPVDQMSADMKAADDFTTKLRGFVPGPHKIWLANPKLSETIVPTGAYFQTESTLTKAEIEIATAKEAGTRLQWAIDPYGCHAPLSEKRAEIREVISSELLQEIILK